MQLLADLEIVDPFSDESCAIGQVKDSSPPTLEYASQMNTKVEDAGITTNEGQTDISKEEGTDPIKNDVVQGEDEGNLKYQQVQHRESGATPGLTPVHSIPKANTGKTRKNRKGGSSGTLSP